MKRPIFSDGQAVCLSPSFHYENEPRLEKDRVYHVAQNVWKGGQWYVQLVEIGCMKAFTQGGFVKSRKSNLTVALLNSVAPHPF